jgi:Domain of unknown function (DUF6429)
MQRLLRHVGGVTFAIFCHAEYGKFGIHRHPKMASWFLPTSDRRGIFGFGVNITRGSSIMDIDRDRIDDAVLALLFLGHHDGIRTWKSFDWAVMERLHTKGFISDQLAKLNPSHSLTKACVSQKHCSEKLFTVGRET